ncbi:hypothetical protein ABW19_dt0201851 [Dactylella cylindrospora]|nr:hypothetical protein ABW19_dt0201851 [Dactylella cylindrospora]
MSLDPSLLTAAISALVGCRVITYEEYLHNPSREFQPLDIEAFHKSVLFAPPLQLELLQPDSSQFGSPWESDSPQSESCQSESSQLESWEPELSQFDLRYLELAQVESWQSGTPQPPDEGLGFMPHTAEVVTQVVESNSPLTWRPVTIFVKTLSGRTITIFVTLHETIDHIKQRIAEKEDIPPEEQRLVYAGKQLDDDFTLHDYGIRQLSTIHLALRILGGGPRAMYISEGFRDSLYDWDFRKTNDAGKAFFRGGKKYMRPCGWRRFAINVNGKYGPDDWLGSSNAPGEWPVSYHGTSKAGALSIAEEGFKLAKGVRFAYGRGIYSSPNHAIAERFAKSFWNKGKRYKVIFQNRVNPANLRQIPKRDYWISPTDDDIRPYGLCIKEI